MIGRVQPYAWGSKTAIPQLLRYPVDGTPQAELWLGAHPKGPSTVVKGLLNHLVDADPAGVVGTASVRAFGPRLPYLLKLLAADQPLSLQAHPTRIQAEAGFAREQAAGIAPDAPDRIYADNWPKPEMLIALGDVEALCGFREPAETHALFVELGVESALDVVEPLSNGGPEALAAVFGQLLRPDSSGREVVSQVVTAAAETTTDNAELRLFARTAVELDAFYPGDPGIIAALTMNRLKLGATEALFLPAGNLHAYLRGFGVEIMANSDNVLRGGLTDKHIAVEELLDVLDFTPGIPDLAKTVVVAAGVTRYLTPAPEFALWRIETNGVSRSVPAEASGRILLCTHGRVLILGESEDLVLAAGEAGFAYPSERLEVSGTGTAYVAAPGL